MNVIDAIDIKLEYSKEWANYYVDTVWPLLLEAPRKQIDGEVTIILDNEVIKQLKEFYERPF